MGTRSTVKFYDNGGCVASIYQQYDGYPSVVGLALAKFLSKKKIINVGFETIDEYANGIGCLAAQYIAEIKTGIGGVYMATENDVEQYNYKVTADDNMVLKIVLEEEIYGLTSVVEIFSGTVAEFLEYCESE